MEIEEQLKKVLELYQESNGVCIWKNIEIYDTDFTTIWMNNKTLYFEFDEDEFKNFIIRADDIAEIKFEIDDQNSTSIITLKNGDWVMIHNL